MARDLFTKLHWCRYCERPATIRWSADLATCTREICQGLAFAELRRRDHSPRKHAA